MSKRKHLAKRHGFHRARFIYFCKSAEGQMLTEYPICMGACPATDGMCAGHPGVHARALSLFGSAGYG